MKDNLVACTATNPGMQRRDFLRNSLLMSVPLVMAGTGLSGTASASVYVPPTRKRGSTTRNVKNYGAVGNGSHDDTAAIQAAINSLPSTGGTVYVPAGTYMINAVRSVNLRSLMHLKLDPDAKLVAIPTSSGSYNVVFADVSHDVEISGGQILGERDHHKGTGGEGGHCIRIRGCSAVTIRDTRLANGWGDGMTVGPKPRYRQTFIYSSDVAIANIVCTNNRRNGLSIGNVLGIKVYDSEFSYTHGTSPQCGIDVEPSHDIDGSGHCNQVYIKNCVMKNNAHYGVNVWKNSHNLTITQCQIKYNGTCGMVTRGLSTATFTNNMIYNNQSTGLFIQDGSNNVTISGHTSYNNYLKLGLVNRADFYLTGVNSKIAKDLIVGSGTSKIYVGKNLYK